MRLEAVCAAARGCDTAPSGGAGDRTRARLAVQRASVTVIDRSVPNLYAAGDMLESAWRRGEARAVLAAADNVGVRATSLRVDGVTRDVDRHSCDHTRTVPCPRSVRSGYRLDTRTLADGQHRVELGALDAAGNPRSREQLIRVDNTPPAPVRDLRVLGSDGIRSRNSFALRWTAPGGQAAPIVRARYRLCRRDVVGNCVRGVRPATAGGTSGLAVPGRGAWRLRVWLEDAAGNASETSASEPVLLRFDDRRPTRMGAKLVRGDGRATVAFGARPVVRGSLRSVRGPALARERVTVTTRVRGSSRHRRVGAARTSAAGRYRLRLPRGPSSTVTVRYPGSGRQRPAVARVRLAVRARSSIAVSRRRVANGARILFRGRLLGAPVPPQGKLVQLEAHYRGRWRTFAVVRSDDRGRWRRHYRFGGTTGRVVYPFRVRVPRDSRYPYAVGHSRVVRVTVTGR